MIELGATRTPRLPGSAKSIAHELAHRQIAKNAHADHQPDHLLGWQPASTNCRRPPRHERLFDPLGIEARDELRQEVFARSLENTIRKTRHRAMLIVRFGRNKPSGQEPEFRNNVSRLALTDRHWS